MSGRSTSRGRLPDRLAEHLRRTELISPDDAVLVALSGGLDSVTLLHLLRFSLRSMDLRLTAVHVDHGMRPGSAADAAWVRGVCRAWDVPCRVVRLDPAPTSEEGARAGRYRALEAAARETHTDSIVTAHHLDDQAETVLFRAIRGTGLRGLRGILPRRGRIVRPLLPFSRREISDHARGQGIRYRVDPTNRSLALARNRLRHEVLPVLEAARPGAARSLARLADRARSAEEASEAALRRLRDDVVVSRSGTGAELARPVLLSYHPDLRVRMLRYLLRRYGSTPDRAGTQAALEFITSGSSGGEIHLAGGVRLERDFDTIRIVAEPTDPRPDRVLEIPDPGAGSGIAEVGGRRIAVIWGDGAGKAGGERVSLATPVFPLTIRGWRPGDRIRFGYGSKKLKELFRERRLDRVARRRAVVVEDGNGRVVWVAGVARAEGVGEDGVGFEIAVEDAE